MFFCIKHYHAVYIWINLEQKNKKKEKFLSISCSVSMLSRVKDFPEKHKILLPSDDLYIFGQTLGSAVPGDIKDKF